MDDLKKLIDEKERLIREKKQIEEKIRKLKEAEKGYECGTYKLTYCEYMGHYGYKLSAVERSDRKNAVYKVLAFSESRQKMMSIIRETIGAMNKILDYMAQAEEL